MNRTFILLGERQRSALASFLMANAAGPVLQCVVSLHQPKRNLEQNALLYALESEIAGKAWINGRQYSVEAYHEYFLNLFAPRVNGIDGPIIKRSSKMSKQELSDHIDAITAYAITDLGVEL